MRVLVLGAGFGGLELATTLSERLGSEADVTLIDRSEGFVFGFSKLDVLFGRAEPPTVLHPYRFVDKPGVRFVRASIEAIDPASRRVETDGGAFEGDVLVVALGADVDPGATPGLVEGGYEFYTLGGAIAARDALAAFASGRVVVGVTSTPFKCPVAPSEAALLTHDFFTQRGRRDDVEISLVMPFSLPVPPSPDASAALLAAFADRQIRWIPEESVRELDVERHVLRCHSGAEVPCDLFLAIPTHRAPSVVEASGLCVDGWIPVDPRTLETSFPGVYAVGDVTSVGTPKAGAFAEGQAAVVAASIVARQRGGASADEYSGRGQCYLEFGHAQVARVDVTFSPGRPPVGSMDGPSVDLVQDKSEFSSTRLARWFDLV